MLMQNRAQPEQVPAENDSKSSELGSVSRWVRDLQTDEVREEAMRRIWDRYFKHLVALAGKRMPSQRVVDGEDVASAAFSSFFERACERDGFRKLKNREDVWQLLTMIVARKVVNHIEHEHRQKRGSGTVVGEEVLLRRWGSAGLSDGLALVLGTAPTPDMVAEVEDEVQYLLEMLSDEDLQQVAEWKADGYSNAEISDNLNRSERTVERYISTIRARWKTVVQ